MNLQARSLSLLLLLAPLASCGANQREPGAATSSPLGEQADPFAEARQRMVATQIRSRGITDPRVLSAMAEVPRHLFVPPDLREHAYTDRPLPIAHEQTISQPYIVAFMTAALELDGDEAVLEVGTGSGYQAAVLAEIVERVFTIEIVEPLGLAASRLLEDLGYDNVETRIGDGYGGWPEFAPFDAIMVTAAPAHVPAPLVEQLAVGGRLILPVGRQRQELVLVEKTAEGVVRRSLLDVRFVPMTGEALEPRAAAELDRR